ncbi:MAG: phospholipid carrier-dependent glycosyltransferase [Chitinophagales bacterium]|nr:phospholipid carrier-dependent glycosyltransferase [Chitinophagales bacterium]
MKRSLQRVFLALIIFTVAFLIRVPLVDRYYQYSFEPDSESCVNVTRSFYFFFKHPKKANFPYELSSYPNYSDGAFIVSAIIANAAKELSHLGLAPQTLADSNNSVIIYGMRCSGVLLDSLSAMLAFLILTLVVGNHWIALVLSLLVYLLNPHTLLIDFVRIDHFVLFTANLSMLAAVVVFLCPQKWSSYLLLGIAIGLTSGTKINFPFFLLLPFLVVMFLIATKQLRLRHFLVAVFSFLFTFMFIYQRWLLYPENIRQVLAETIEVGKEWNNYWDNGNYDYYLWDEFFQHGFSWGVALLLILAYGSLLTAVIKLAKNDRLVLLLATAFILQSIALMLSPKIGRYGILMPLWICLFLGLGYRVVSNRRFFQVKSMYITVLGILLLLPYFAYAYQDYNTIRIDAINRKKSIEDTRIAAYNWLKANGKAGYKVAYQHPRVSAPPMFELPFNFTEEFSYRFLKKETLLSFHPPTKQALSKINVLVLCDKEINYHLLALREANAEPSLIAEWEKYYRSLDRIFPSVAFSSPYRNYGVSSYKMYLVDSMVNSTYPRISIANPNNEATALVWDFPTYYMSNFELQISKDSSMQWLSYGIMDGFPSKHRTVNTIWNLSVVPPKALALLKVSTANKPSEKELAYFFGNILRKLAADTISLRDAISSIVENSTTEAVCLQIASLYPNHPDLLDGPLETYLAVTDLPFTREKILKESITNNFSFAIPKECRDGRTYYWRIRAKTEEIVYSQWSDIHTFSVNL